MQTGYKDLDNIDNILDQIEDGEGMISCSEYASKML